jgi:hypothetical protein
MKNNFYCPYGPYCYQYPYHPHIPMPTPGEGSHERGWALTIEAVRLLTALVQHTDAVPAASRAAGKAAAWFRNSGWKSP